MSMTGGTPAPTAPATTTPTPTATTTTAKTTKTPKTTSAAGFLTKIAAGLEGAVESVVGAAGSGLVSAGSFLGGLTAAENAALQEVVSVEEAAVASLEAKEAAVLGGTTTTATAPPAAAAAPASAPAPATTGS